MMMMMMVVVVLCDAFACRRLSAPALRRLEGAALT